jgi:hypothetical protein
MPKKQKAPKAVPHWGAFLALADEDLLAFAWLFSGGLHLSSYYHAAQALEKYFKSLILATVTSLPTNTSWLNSHDLSHLAVLCSPKFPYYGEAATKKKLALFTEYDAATRYPLVPRQHGNGFTSAEVPAIWDLIRHLRQDIPIVRDDYLLGMVVRGHHHGKPNTVHAGDARYRSAKVALLRLFPDVTTIVRR